MWQHCDSKNWAWDHGIHFVPNRELHDVDSDYRMGARAGFVPSCDSLLDLGIDSIGASFFPLSEVQTLVHHFKERAASGQVILTVSTDRTSPMPRPAIRPPAPGFITSKVLRGLVIYQQHISPHLGTHCRYKISCSTYMQMAILKYGLLSGVCRGVRRIFSCHPWSSRPYWDAP